MHAYPSVPGAHRVFPPLLLLALSLLFHIRVKRTTAVVILYYGELIEIRSLSITDYNGHRRALTTNIIMYSPAHLFIVSCGIIPNVCQSA